VQRLGKREERSVRQWCLHQPLTDTKVLETVGEIGAAVVLHCMMI
jgi:hypothetical protein